MNTLFEIGSLQKAQLLLYRRNLVHYAKSVLNRDISFARALKILHFDTGYSPHYLEEDLSLAISALCPLRSERPET